MSKRDASGRGQVVPAVHPKAAACPRGVSRSRPLAVAVGVAWSAALALAPAQAGAQWVDLGDIYAGHGGFDIQGERYYDQIGMSLAAAGDVNGDGLEDIIVGAPYAFKDHLPGRAYVVFGKTDGTVIDLRRIASGHGGFVVLPSTEDTGVQRMLGKSVAGVGDVNGDGLADIVAHDAGRDVPLGSGMGRTYVIFGKTGTAAVQTSEVEAGHGGFIIDGAHPGGDDFGPTSSVAAAGDVNGDGLADVIIGWPADPHGHQEGGAYVVFGKAGNGPVALSNVAAGHGGFFIRAHYDAGNVVAGVGDVNGDGLADVATGWGLGGSPTESGVTYVVFGKAGTAAVDVSAIAAGQGGFVVHGASAGDRSGSSVAGAGDVDGDGLADLVLASPGLDGAHVNGGAHVVYGKKTTEPVELAEVAAGHGGGFIVRGESGMQAGGTTAGIGDINGDGLADILVAPFDFEYYSLFSYVVFGKSGTGRVDLSDVSAGHGGLAITSSFGRHIVSAAGDVNGDGLDDVMVSNPVGNSKGDVWVVFGATTGAFKDTAVDQLGGDGDDTLTGSALAETLVGGKGDDTLLGNGGADVLYGGEGDDEIVVDASTVAALGQRYGAGDNAAQLARVDGGPGFDTLRLVGDHVTLDLGRIPNQGAGTVVRASRIESIEHIDITGSGDNTLRLAPRDVRDMAGMNLINSGTQAALGWTNGTYAFFAKEGRHQLVVTGDAGDVLSLGTAKNGWFDVGTVFKDGAPYVVYDTGTQGPRYEHAQVIVSADVTVDVAPPPGSDPGRR